MVGGEWKGARGEGGNVKTKAGMNKKKGDYSAVRRDEGRWSRFGWKRGGAVWN